MFSFIKIIIVYLMQISNFFYKIGDPGAHTFTENASLCIQNAAFL